MPAATYPPREKREMSDSSKVVLAFGKVTYLKKTNELIVNASAMRNGSPAGGVKLDLLIRERNVCHRLMTENQTDVYGKTTFLVRDLQLAVGSHDFGMQAYIADRLVAEATHILEVTNESPVDEHVPKLSFTTTTHDVVDAFWLFVHVQATREEKPIPNLTVQIEAEGLHTSLKLDGDGRGTARLILLNPKQLSGWSTLVTVTAQKPAMQATAEVVLRRTPVPMPKRVTIMKPSKSVGSNTYKILVNVENADGPLDGVPVFWVGGTKGPGIALSNHYGVATIEEEPIPGIQGTDIQVDIPGIAKVPKIPIWPDFELPVQAPVRVQRLGLGNTAGQHFHQAYRIGAGTALYEASALPGADASSVRQRATFGEQGKYDYVGLLAFYGLIECLLLGVLWIMQHYAKLDAALVQYLVLATPIVPVGLWLALRKNAAVPRWLVYQLWPLTVYGCIRPVGWCIGKAASTNNRRALAFVGLTVACLVYTFVVLGSDVLYFIQGGLSVLSGSQPPTAPIHWLTWWQAALTFVGMAVFTVVYGIASMREEVKYAWNKAVWKWQTRHASIVLEAEKPSVVERLVDTVLPVKGAPTAAALATVTTTAPASAPVTVQVEQPKEKKSALQMAEIGQWVFILGHTLQELVQIISKKRR